MLRVSGVWLLLPCAVAVGCRAPNSIFGYGHEGEFMHAAGLALRLCRACALVAGARLPVVCGVGFVDALLPLASRHGLSAAGLGF